MHLISREERYFLGETIIILFLSLGRFDFEFKWKGEGLLKKGAKFKTFFFIRLQKLVWKLQQRTQSTFVPRRRQQYVASLLEQVFLQRQIAILSKLFLATNITFGMDIEFSGHVFVED